LNNETLTNIEGFQAADPDLTMTINRADLEQVMMGQKTLMAMIEDGTAKVEGNASILAKIGATMATFDPRFPIMPGTRLRGPELPEADPYEVQFGGQIAE
jgi:alkyl sulfatase BDS1-like metallo-beta-lactamase superfamily hydrolase